MQSIEHDADTDAEVDDEIETSDIEDVKTGNENGMKLKLKWQNGEDKRQCNMKR